MLNGEPKVRGQMIKRALADMHAHVEWVHGFFSGGSLLPEQIGTLVCGCCDIYDDMLGRYAGCHRQPGGWVNVAPCIPADPLCVYHRALHRAQRFEVPMTTQAKALGSIFCSVHTVTKGGRPTTGRATESAFLRHMNAQKCKLLLTATYIDALKAWMPMHIRLLGL